MQSQSSNCFAFFAAEAKSAMKDLFGLFSEVRCSVLSPFSPGDEGVDPVPASWIASLGSVLPMTWVGKKVMSKIALGCTGSALDWIEALNSLQLLAM